MNKKRTFKFFCLLAAAAVLLAIVLWPGGADALFTGGRKPETVIIHTNDSHGRAAANDTENIMGFAAVAALKKEYEAKGCNVLILDAGDTFHGLPIASADEGGNIITLMNMVGYDAMCPGNHDFNYGTKRLLELAGQADFPILSANILYTSNGENLLTPMNIIEQQGIRYGIFGLMTPELPEKTSPDKISGLMVGDPVVTAQLCVKRLKDEGVDYIIGLTHMGTDTASECTSAQIAKEVNGIDIIVDGHSHSSYPSGLEVSGALIVSAGEWMKEIGIVNISPDGVKKAQLLTADKYTARDQKVEEAAASMQKEVEDMLGEVIATALTDLNGDRKTVRVMESNLGDWAAETVKEATGADVALLSGGGIRASIPKGEITKGELLTAFPFNNSVVIAEVSGQVLLDALEHGLAAAPAPSGAFPQIAGIRLEYDSSLPAGQRVLGVRIGNRPLSVNMIYKAAITDHIAAGGDGYEMFVKSKLSKEYISLLDILALGMIQEGNILSETDGRIVDVSMDTK